MTLADDMLKRARRPRKECTHDRTPETCVRCDIWCPRDASEDDLNRWQAMIDQKDDR
jgi:hypothetical protein